MPVKVKGSATAKPAAKSELDALKEMVEQQNAQIKSLLERQSTGGGGRRNNNYAPPQTPREVAEELLALPTLTKEQEKEAIRWYQIRESARNLVDIAQLFVKRIPGSPVDATHPYGQPELVWNKAHTTQLNTMKDGVDRGDYIKLRNLVEQLQGDIFSYEDPKPLTDDQIDRVVRPILDTAVKLGVITVE